MADLSLLSLQKKEKKKKKPTEWLSALLFIAACHPSAPHGLRLKPRCASDVQLAVLCDETLDSISSLSELCVCKLSIAPLSACFPRCETLLLRSSQATTKTTVWFLDRTDRLASRWHLVRELGERSCLPRLACQQLWRWEALKKTLKKKVGSSSLMTNSRTEDFMFYGDKARFRSGQVFWGTFRRTVFCLPATRLMINNQIGNVFYFLFFPNRCCDIGVVCERCPARLSSPLPRFWFLCIQRKCLHLISRTHLLNTSAPSSATCALEMRFGLISVTELKI